MDWTHLAFIVAGLALAVVLHYLRLFFKNHSIDDAALSEFAAEMEAYLEEVKTKRTPKKTTAKKSTTRSSAPKRR